MITDFSTNTQKKVFKYTRKKVIPAANRSYKDSVLFMKKRIENCHVDRRREMRSSVYMICSYVSVSHVSINKKTLLSLDDFFFFRQTPWAQKVSELKSNDEYFC